MDILDSIAALDTAILEPATEQTVATWWNLYDKIENSILSDGRATNEEKQYLLGLKEGLNDATLIFRTHARTDTGLTSVRLSALKHAIERRTIGPE